MSPPTNSRPSATRSFLIDNLFTGIAQILTKLRGVLLIPLLIRGLGTDAYGLYVQVFSLAAFAGSVLALNLHLPFLQMSAANKASAPSIFATLLPTTLAVTALGCLALGAFAGPEARGLLVGQADSSLFHLALAITFAQAARTFLLNGYRATDRIKLRGTLDFVGSLGDVVVAIAIVASGGGLAAVLAGSAGWSLTFAAAMGGHVTKLLGLGSPRKSILRDALYFSVPLIPASFGILTLERADRFLIGAKLGPESVGIYSAQLAVATLVSTILLPLQITLLPKVASLWVANRTSAQRYLEVSLRLFSGSAILFIALCPFVVPTLLRTMANDSVAAGSALNVSLMAAGVALWGVGVLQATVLYAARRTVLVGLSTALSAAANVALNLLLIPRLGILGSAIAKAAAYALTAVALGIGVAKELPIRYGASFLVRCVLGVPLLVSPFLLLPPTPAGVLIAMPLAVALFLIGLIATGAVKLAELRLAANALRASGQGSQK